MNQRVAAINAALKHMEDNLEEPDETTISPCHTHNCGRDPGRFASLAASAKFPHRSLVVWSDLGSRGPKRRVPARMSFAEEELCQRAFFIRAHLPHVIHTAGVAFGPLFLRNTDPPTQCKHPRSNPLKLQSFFEIVGRTSIFKNNHAPPISSPRSPTTIPPQTSVTMMFEHKKTVVC